MAQTGNGGLESQPAGQVPLAGAPQPPASLALPVHPWTHTRFPTSPPGLRHHLSQEVSWSPPSHLIPAPRGSGATVQQPGLPLDPDPVNTCLPAPRAPRCPQACGPGVLSVLSVSPSPLPCIPSPGLGPFSLSWEPPGQEQYPAKRPASSMDAGEVRGSWAPRGLLGPPLWSRGSWALPCGSGAPGGASGGRAWSSSWSPQLPTSSPSGQLWRGEPCSKGFQARQGNVVIRPRDARSKAEASAFRRDAHPRVLLHGSRGGAGPSLARGNSCSSRAPPISASRARGPPLWSLMSPSCVPPAPHDDRSCLPRVPTRMFCTGTGLVAPGRRGWFASDALDKAARCPAQVTRGAGLGQTGQAAREHPRACGRTRRNPAKWRPVP